MREPAGDNERTECQEHPVKWNILSRLGHEISQRRRDANVRQANQEIGGDMEEDDLRIPKITSGMGHELIRSKESSDKVWKQQCEHRHSGRNDKGPTNKRSARDLT